MKHIWTIALLLVTGIGVLPAAWSEEDRIAQIEGRIAETKARLKLSDEQIERLTPILKSGFEAQMAVLEKHGIDLENRGSGNHGKLGFREARQLKKELDVVRKSNLSQVEGLMSEEQFSEYRKIQDERKKKMREKIKAQR